MIMLKQISIRLIIKFMDLNMQSERLIGYLNTTTNNKTPINLSYKKQHRPIQTVVIVNQIK